jgi:nucleoside-diphosphate-sugar epimerase
MKALVTGVGGFVGAHLAARLVDDGWDVTGTVRPGGRPWRLELLGVAAGVEVAVVEADLSDPRATAAAARSADPDVTFLLAAARSAATPEERATTAAVNGSSGLWLIDALPKRCRTVVRLGSSTEYGEVSGPMDEGAPLRPRGYFGASKAAGSLLAVAAAARRGMRSAVLRAFQVYGPHDHEGRLVPSALRAARAGTPLPLTGPGRRRDWVYVDDVVEACIRVAGADHLPAGQVLNVGTGRQVANEELVAEVERVTGRPVRLVEGGHPGREWDAASWVCDPSLARELLGWEAKVELADGLACCWELDRASDRE